MQKSIRSFIVENFLAGKDDPDFRNEDSFLDSRVIDSTGILELIDYIEDEHSITVEDSEMTTENFDSVAKVATYIESKLA